tara:strand:+ start:4250 stop:4564 length:315 start_codon:yes stop_codon:yes gene_type:complete
MITDDEKAEAAHNALSDSDDEYGRVASYVKMAPHITKLIKAKAFLNTSGTVAERDAMAYASQDYKDFVNKLSDSMVEYEILNAKRESWQREVDIWRTVSANRRK